MLKRRLLGALAAAVAVTFVLAGCSLIPAVVGLSAHATRTVPKVGQCWSATASDAAAWADWKGASNVKCAGSHELYTYAVGKVTGVSAKSWGTGGTLSPAIQIKAEDACSLSTLLPKLKWNQQLVEGFFFVPSEADWKAGERWVRCDVGVLSFGTTLSNEALATLPPKISTLVSAVSSDPERFAFCLNSPVPVSEAGPLADQDARIADCRTNPQWALAGHGNLPEAEGSPYPSDATANADTAKICTKYAVNSNEVWIAYLPNAAKDGTVSSDRVVECWVGQKSATGTGSGGVA